MYLVKQELPPYIYIAETVATDSNRLNTQHSTQYDCSIQNPNVNYPKVNRRGVSLFHVMTTELNIRRVRINVTHASGGQEKKFALLNIKFFFFLTIYQVIGAFLALWRNVPEREREILCKHQPKHQRRLSWTHPQARFRVLQPFPISSRNPDGDGQWQPSPKPWLTKGQQPDSNRQISRQRKTTQKEKPATNAEEIPSDWTVLTESAAR